MMVNRSVDTNSILESTKIGATSDKSCETVSKINIPITTVDEFCQENDISKIDILKMDVQGAELKVLEGSIKMLKHRSIKMIYTELYFVPQYHNQPLFHEVTALLYEYGYILQDIYDPYYNKTSILWCDSIYILKDETLGNNNSH